MVQLFGDELSRAELARLMPDITGVAGIRHLMAMEGPEKDGRILQIESGGGLRVDLLPDRCCDIGQVWFGAFPFGWIGALGIPRPEAVKANTTLGGMMTTCGFDHIRQPETDDGRHYSMHGGMLHMPSRVVSSEAVWLEDQCVFRIVVEATQFGFDRGALRLRRHVYVPMGGATLLLLDQVTVLSGSVPVMAMYHFNFGFPLVGKRSRLALDGREIGAHTFGSRGALVNPSGKNRTLIRLDAGPDGPGITLAYRGEELPYLQTFRIADAGINILSLEPASHDRLPRAELRECGALEPLGPGSRRSFHLDMHFETGSSPVTGNLEKGLAAALRLREADERER